MKKLKWIRLEKQSTEFDTYIMEVPGGCVMRTELQNKSAQGSRSSEALVFIPGVEFVSYAEELVSL